MDEIRETLLALRSTGKRSVTGFVRTHLVELESLLESGVQQKAILEKLSDLGFHFNPGAFRSALKVARKERDDQVSGKAPAIPAPGVICSSSSRSVDDEKPARGLDKLFQGRSLMVDLDNYR